MLLVLTCYLLVTPSYSVATSGYFVVTSGYLIVTTGYFSLLWFIVFVTTRGNTLSMYMTNFYKSGK